MILRAADMAHVPEVQAASGVSLLSEGFEMVDTDAIIESFARHLMTAFDRWKERGFEATARDYLERLPKRKAGERLLEAVEVEAAKLVCLRDPGRAATTDRFRIQRHGLLATANQEARRRRAHFEIP